MPRAFTEQERSQVREALIVAGTRRFQREGVRAARVDDLCREAGIAKGSFYAFFPSKEELFLAIVEGREEQHRADLANYLRSADGEPDRIAGILFDTLIYAIETDPMLSVVVAHHEIPHLVRKLGSDRFQAARRSHADLAEEVIRLWVAGGRPKGMSAADFLSMLTLMLALATQRSQMPTDQYRPAVTLLRTIFVERLAGRGP